MKIISWLNLSGRLAVGTLLLVSFIISGPAAATDRTSDAFLTGYVTSILERDLHWQKDSYLLKIKNGSAKITLFTDDPVRRRAVDRQLREIDGLQEVTVELQPEHAVKPGFVTSNSFSSLGERYPTASIDFGETFGLYRSFGNHNEGIGIPLTSRFGESSIRSRSDHQSSHLGNELLRSVPPGRINHSYEATNSFSSWERQAWRVYGGGENLVREEPDDLRPASPQGELEYRGSLPFVLSGRLVAGQGLNSLEEQDWTNDTRVKADLESGRPNPGQRRLRLMAEQYQGGDPYGRFYSNKVEYYGIGGISLGF